MIETQNMINLILNSAHLSSYQQLQKMRRKNVHSPVKITYKNTTSKVGPQEVIISETSIKNYELSEDNNDREQKNSQIISKDFVALKKTTQSAQDKRMNNDEEVRRWSSDDPVRRSIGSIQQINNQEEQGELKEGQYTFTNGDTYIGNWKDKWIQGYGVYNFAKINLQYRGQFKRSQQHGSGVLLRIPTGQQKEEEIYNGEWINGQKNGLGKYYYFKDTFYDGNWCKNVKEGHGTFKSPEGEFVGEWKNDKKNGTGILRLKNGNIFEGQWVDDSFVQGMLTYSNGDKYEGQFQNFLRHGYGTYTYSNKTVYRGYWQNNQKSGSGEVKYFNGDVFQGNMKEGRRDGPDCQYSWSTGQRIHAEFQNDIPAVGKIRIPSEGQSQFNLLK